MRVECSMLHGRHCSRYFLWSSRIFDIEEDAPSQSHSALCCAVTVHAEANSGRHPDEAPRHVALRMALCALPSLSWKRRFGTSEYSDDESDGSFAGSSRRNSIDICADAFLPAWSSASQPSSPPSDTSAHSSPPPRWGEDWEHTLAYSRPAVTRDMIHAYLEKQRQEASRQQL